MIDYSLATALTAVLENALNRALQYDPGTQHKFQSLAGQKLGIVISDFNCALFLTTNEQLVSITIVPDTELDGIHHDARVEGTLSDLATLLLTDQYSHSLSKATVTISGNTRLISEYQDVFSDIEIDWEEALIEKFGTVIGHQLAEQIRLFVGWGTAQSKTLSKKLPEYITEELQLLPTKIEFEILAQEIDILRSGSERLEARLNKILKIREKSD
ncbi:SCP2 domain-containing protein [Teredinibacter sp. KSP-S5-2]|uniref:ubiquinone biosynthesis accessory factor UbiJ n=1 Tax=Teredinibacter sp. KSP-S5-2 TaxID=3034506 RepID=UPI002934748D|nr:hypothetical protein [Teredinibacter sp. KSP-S5-2]WNO08206.1 hypothetical protein P5V12_14625 [Teredinibacter sp. KSP-S5-2]